MEEGVPWPPWHHWPYTPAQTRLGRLLSCQFFRMLNRSASYRCSEVPPILSATKTIFASCFSAALLHILFSQLPLSWVYVPIKDCCAIYHGLRFHRGPKPLRNSINFEHVWALIYGYDNLRIVKPRIHVSLKICLKIRAWVIIYELAFPNAAFIFWFSVRFHTWFFMQIWQQDSFEVFQFGTSVISNYRYQIQAV